MTPTEQDKELRDILSKVLLDGQNQIHDLKDGKATPEQIIERMFASLDYWQPKILQLITADRKKHELDAAIKALEETMPHTDGMRHYNTVVKRITELKAEL